MSHRFCPLCSGPLDSRNVVPCYICGPQEADEAGPVRRHGAYDLLGCCLVLCDGCYVEEVLAGDGGTGRHHALEPAFLGLPPDTKLGRALRAWVGDTDLGIVRDSACAGCGVRLRMARFVLRARERAST